MKVGHKTLDKSKFCLVPAGTTRRGANKLASKRFKYDTIDGPDCMSVHAMQFPPAFDSILSKAFDEESWGVKAPSVG